MTLSNIVKEKQLKEVQKETIQSISDVISKTAGPYGSSTMILHDDRLTEYSKDGHKVLSNIQYFKPIERAVHNELVGITEYVIHNIGDGTTSAVQLSNILFNKLCNYIDANPTIPQHFIVDALDTVVSCIKEEISKNGHSLTLDDVHDICMIATNGNKEVSKDIYDIYNDIGMSVFIELGTAHGSDTIRKTFDGIFLSKGYASSAFINTGEPDMNALESKDAVKTKKSNVGTVNISSPRIYYFEDNVDDAGMINMFLNIFTNNIFTPYSNKNPDGYIPTIIIAPSISQDAKSELLAIEQIFHGFDTQKLSSNKPPFCIVTGINANDDIDNIVMLCACPPIKKYINPDVHEADIKAGKAPTPDTITEWYGTADMVIVDNETTKFINPKLMFDEDAEIAEDGSRPVSRVYNGLINHLEAELELAQNNNESVTVIGSIKKRLNHLKANFVEYLVGGVAASDRDNVKDLAEDAILNCRSASNSGVGRGANFEGLLGSSAVAKAIIAENKSKLVQDIATMIADSYTTLVRGLYSTAFESEEDMLKALQESIELGQPINLRTKSYDDKVLCSIDSDKVILEGVAKIVSVMVLSNQALVQEPTRNVYIDIDEK